MDLIQQCVHVSARHRPEPALPQAPSQVFGVYFNENSMLSCSIIFLPQAAKDWD